MTVNDTRTAPAKRCHWRADRLHLHYHRLSLSAHCVGLAGQFGICGRLAIRLPRVPCVLPVLSRPCCCLAGVTCATTAHAEPPPVGVGTRYVSHRGRLCLGAVVSDTASDRVCERLHSTPTADPECSRRMAWPTPRPTHRAVHRRSVRGRLPRWGVLPHRSRPRWDRTRRNVLRLRLPVKHVWYTVREFQLQPPSSVRRMVHVLGVRRLT